jgi:hypothetical protein
MTGRRVASCLIGGLLSLLLVVSVPAQPQQPPVPPVPQQPFPQKPLPQQPLPKFPQQPQQPQPQRPTMPQRPTLTVQAAPTFTGAALLPGSRFILFGATQIETVEGFCTDPSGDNVCRLLAPAYKATLNGQAANVCRLAGADLTCTLPAAVTVSDGQTVTVTLSKAAAQPGGTAPTTSRSFTAYQCAPAIAGITASGNTFTVTGTGLQPPVAAFTRTLTVSETAQGQLIGRIPATIASSAPTTLSVTLDHPNLSKKILRFQIDMACPGWSAATSNVVLRDSTPSGGPFGGGKSTNREFRMPGALDTNSALVSDAAMVWAPGAAQPSATVTAVVGQANDYAFQTFLRNGGTAPIANVSLEMTTTGSLVLGSPLSLTLPQLRQLGNESNKLPFSCSIRTPGRYLCEVPAFPVNPNALWQLLVDFSPTGTVASTGTVTLHAFGPTLTNQFVPITVPVAFDAANTADRAIAPLSMTSGVVPGTDYVGAAFPNLLHTVRASLVNNGPATMTGPSDLLIFIGNPQGATSEWRVETTSMPAGCQPFGTADHLQYLSLQCTPTGPLAPGQALNIDVQVKLTQSGAPGAGWPSCAPGCIPTTLAVNAVVAKSAQIKFTPPLDPDYRNNRYPPFGMTPAGDPAPGTNQSLALCATSWTVSEPKSNGRFEKLRCGP